MVNDAHATKIPSDNLFIKLAKRIVPDPVKLATKARWKAGRIALNIPDRLFLEEVAIPYYRELDSVKRVLDIGTDWYTWRYEKLFPNQEYQSIDFDLANGADEETSLRLTFTR